MIDTEQIVSRGRPRGFDAEHGVEVAARLFRARGYDAVGVAEICAALGIKAPSFYAAYGRKAELLKRALAFHAASESGFIFEALDGDGPLADRLTALLTEAARVYGADPSACGCLVIEATRNSACSEARTMTRDMRAATRGLIQTRISRDRPDVAEAIADFVMVALAGLSASARDGASSAALARSAEIAAAGLRPDLDPESAR
jgi:TetR/AcrR family transcriptional repressor for divergent bdcA